MSRPDAYDRARQHLAAASQTDDPACIDCFGRMTVEPLLDYIDALEAATPVPSDEPGLRGLIQAIIDGDERGDVEYGWKSLLRAALRDTR